MTSLHVYIFSCLALHPDSTTFRLTDEKTAAPCPLLPPTGQSAVLVLSAGILVTHTQTSSGFSCIMNYLI